VLETQASSLANPPAQRDRVAARTLRCRRSLAYASLARTSGSRLNWHSCLASASACSKMYRTWFVSVIVPARRSLRAVLDRMHKYHRSSAYSIL
jgi:hypothetical protein